MILVTGATGKVGGAVVESLADLGVEYRAATRDPSRAAELSRSGHTAVVADFVDPGSLAEAMEGVDVVFLMSSQHPQQVELQGNVVTAAAAGQVAHVVKLSGGHYLTGSDSGSWVGEAHWHTEQEIADSDLAFTFLQPNYFMQNLLAFAAPVAGGRLPVPISPEQQLAMIDARDIGVAAARVLADPESHSGRTYDLTGPAAVSFGDVAAELERVLGHPVEHVTPSIEDTVAVLREKGAPDWLQRHVGEIMGIFGNDAAVGVVSEDFEQIVGRPPRAVATFATDYEDVFRAASGA